MSFVALAIAWRSSAPSSNRTSPLLASTTIAASP
jgi:hypothetical protein